MLLYFVLCVNKINDIQSVSISIKWCINFQSKVPGKNNKTKNANTTLAWEKALQMIESMFLFNVNVTVFCILC